MVAVSIRDYNLQFYNHQMTLYTSTDLTVEIYEAACTCFEKLWNGLPIRYLGIHTSHVTQSEFRQSNLFETVDYEKQRKAEAAIDTLRKRFGKDSVMRASFLPSPSGNKKIFIDHMGGGISRDRQTVDYTKETIL